MKKKMMILFLIKILILKSKKNSPGWKRYQDNLNQPKENIKTINYTENLTEFTVGETVKHDGFGEGKIIHIEGKQAFN
jgi:hypothetical protein